MSEDVVPAPREPGSLELSPRRVFVSPEDPVSSFTEQLWSPCVPLPRRCPLRALPPGSSCGTQNVTT